MPVRRFFVNLLISAINMKSKIGGITNITSRFGPTLLDRHIGHNAFQYVVAVPVTALNKKQKGISYDAFVKTITEYHPERNSLWSYASPFGMHSVMICGCFSICAEISRNFCKMAQW